MENSLKNAKLKTTLIKMSIPVLVVLGLAIISALTLAVFLNVSESNKKKVFEELDAITKNLDELRDLDDETEKKTKEDEAIASLKEFIENNGKYPGAVLRAGIAKGDLHFDKKEFTEARDAYIAAAKAIENVYIAGIAYYNAAVASEELEDAEKAAEYFKLSYQQKDFGLASHAMFNAGRMLDTLEKYNEAAEIFNELVEKFPEDPWADLAKSRLLSMEVAGFIETETETEVEVKTEAETAE